VPLCKRTKTKTHTGSLLAPNAA